MISGQRKLFVLFITLASLLVCSHVASCQIFDRLFSTNERRSEVPTTSVEQERSPGLRGVFRDMFTVSVPAFYEMVKSGNSMGINAVSGLVRVEKGAEAERSGLIGPRPLSVRVFGVPVYERGLRIRQPSKPSESQPSAGGEPKVEDEAPPSPPESPVEEESQNDP